ncbi:50S ribosomal protein L11 methyltransferase [Aestuariispira insulae]|uniref:Ribosomal protein L11 methyltransferase n=1 Tax=Aestuariispira insulae TaxID=1461337 RepID=A0A3D9HXA3_9PROT|nr:50S ribosomal protein L11 methyltransferase [Aestuariispira insulae]RED54132.1 [LSU ribosomal protein L11P]-lysine N-methyltransferase [Aestuariispira insulae]
MTAQAVWKLEIILPDAEAAELFGAALDDMHFAAAAFEMVPDVGPWRLECYCDGEPDASALGVALALASLQAGISEPDYKCEPLPDVNWVAENQKSFRPIRAGRFFVHPSHFEGVVPAGSWALKVDAATAFGTGEHATTRGCLLAIDQLAKSREIRRPLDLGTGTGILAMGIAKAWPVGVVASDIDPEAVKVTDYNAVLNGMRGRIYAIESAGFRDRTLKDSGPYDLIVANILANPLRKMARDIATNLVPGGDLILSGLLETQQAAVLQAYREQGLKLHRRYPIDRWMTLHLRAW